MNAVYREVTRQYLMDAAVAAGQPAPSVTLNWSPTMSKFPHPALSTRTAAGLVLGPFVFAGCMFGSVTQVGQVHAEDDTEVPHWFLAGLCLLLAECSHQKYTHVMPGMHMAVCNGHYSVLTRSCCVGAKIQMTQLVSEKEWGLRQALRNMGMLQSSYWASWMIFDILMSMIVSLAICIFGMMDAQNLAVATRQDMFACCTEHVQLASSAPCTHQPGTSSTCQFAVVQQVDVLLFCAQPTAAFKWGLALCLNCHLLQV